MTEEEVKKHLLSFPDARLDYPFGKEVAVFKVGELNKSSDDNSNMFALINSGKSPVRLSLRCDPKLSVILREKYVEVMPGVNLNKRIWNTMLLTGQLEWNDVVGLIRHSYDLVANETKDKNTY
jgi:predicted DNA-binding protein (MmcQ/YjbR family)